MQWFVHVFQQYPELAIFLTLALGFAVGPLKIGKFSLGTVTAVLLMGVLIGQMKIDISPNVKSVFFLIKLFAVGGGTAAMCYVFDSLQQNFLIKKGDTIALMVHTFTPYIEIPKLDRFEFNVLNIEARSLNKDGRHTWQYPEEELDKLKDPAVKISFVVNPSNPPSVAMHPGSMSRIVKIIKQNNPNLIVVTDDVYGTFVPGFRSLMTVIQENTICVYSFSKYFGCTGWRLGVIAVSDKNIFDKNIAQLPDHEKARLTIRYSSITLQPDKLSFIDRMVADSRDVALNPWISFSGLRRKQALYC